MLLNVFEHKIIMPNTYHFYDNHNAGIPRMIIYMVCILKVLFSYTSSCLVNTVTSPGNASIVTEILAIWK